MSRAASIVAVRAGADGPLVVLVRRAGGAMSGSWSFPGGKVEQDDGAPRAQVHAHGLSAAERAARFAAVRELFEETGLLVGGSGLGDGERERLWAEVTGGRLGFAEVLERARIALGLDDVRPLGEVHLRHFVRETDLAVHLALLPGDGGPATWAGPEGEVALGPPRDVLEIWRAGRILMPPTVRARLEVLAAADPSLEGLEGALRAVVDDEADGSGELMRGIRLLPLRTPTLPPATHTNAYLLGTGEARVLVDPGPSDAAEQARLLARLEALGARVTEVWLTHHHPDHVGAAAALKERLGVRIRAHRLTADRLDGLVDQVLEDGEVVPLDGPLPQRWSALHTPGHAPGHLCFHETGGGALLAGDLVAGIGTVVVDPPEGDMGAYLASIERLRGLHARALFPSHGPPTGEVEALLSAYVEHRRAREAAILEALLAGASSTPEIVERAYTDVPRVMHGLAERNVEAHLAHLEARGRVERHGGGWRPR